MPNAVVKVLITETTKPITGEQAEDLLTRIENTITAACEEYGVGAPKLCLAQYDDWMTRDVRKHD